MRKLLLILLVLSLNSVRAQDVLLNQTTKAVLLDKGDVGPNKKKYAHNFLGVSFAVPTRLENETNIYGGSSVGMEYGRRFKRKLSTTFSMGFDLASAYMQYRSKKDTFSFYNQIYGSTSPDSLVTDKLSFTTIRLEPYFRINFGKRGNHLGKYIDLAFYGEFMISSSHVAKFKHENDLLVKKSQVRTRYLKYTNKLFYGPELRYGNAFYNFYVRYRIPDIMNNKLSSSPYQLPNIVAGLNLVIPR
ncbi:MAG: hypothetical protein ACI9J3_003718 [Parvicellaceae bacterium]|jgi:hypothetical protein